MVLMAHTIINSLTTIILSILLPLDPWTTIEMPSKSPPKLLIATGEWATAKRIPCVQFPRVHVLESRLH